MSQPLLVDDELLASWPLPRLRGDGDKHARGQVLVVGGSVLVPAAPLLTGLAALRAGAGKLKVATTASTAIALGVRMPEALVAGLPESEAGGIHPRAAGQVLELATVADVVVLGPGMADPTSVADLVTHVVAHLPEDGPLLVIDATAITSLPLDGIRFDHLKRGAVLTPNADELARLFHEDLDRVDADRQAWAAKAAGHLEAVVTVRGWVAAPDGRIWRHDGGTVGLATSGSGDVQAGIVAGLAARGADAAQAAVWGTYVHGRAGELLSERIGPVGFLARELLDVIPEVLRMSAEHL